jgi:hypothetical protein
MTKATLERKLQRVGDLLVRKLILGTMGRKYRVEDEKGHNVFTVGYRSAEELWERLDFVETALLLCDENVEARSA